MTSATASGELKVGGAFDPQLVTREPHGKAGSLDYRLHFFLKQAEGPGPKTNKTRISPWHDIPLHAGQAKDGVQLYHAVIEIPKWTRKKFEIATGELYNPIKQDMNKEGELRNLDFYQMFNYGALPQTWEDPHAHHHDTELRGDNDPIDCVEIGMRQVPAGGVIVVRVLGVLAMIDDDETDWKLIVINEEDPLAASISDITDLQSTMPGVIDGMRNWFREYKTKLGTKQPNKFALEGKAQNREYAQRVVEETHDAWKQLIQGQSTDKDRSQVVVPSTH